MRYKVMLVLGAIIGGAVFYGFRHLTSHSSTLLTFFVGAILTLMTIVFIRKLKPKQMAKEAALQSAWRAHNSTIIFWSVGTAIALLISYTRTDSWAFGLLSLIEIYFIFLVLYLLVFKVFNWLK
jgi:uncharacterized membrane protein